MISRFTRKAMADIWSSERKFRNWLDIELLACEAQEKIGVVPKGVTVRIRKKAKFDIRRIDEIEREVRHDVIAFLTNVNENVGAESRYIHLGMTSSDIVDTGFSMQLCQAADLLLKGVEGLMAALKKQVKAHSKTLCIGRSHGIHAEPTTFGLKMAGHYAAFARARKRLAAARDEIGVCAISGAVGTFTTIDPRVEQYVASKLKLKVEPVSTQVIPRDRHAMFFATLAVVASSLENLATEIRHLQRTEVREVEEYFSVGQKGSSAMPHKRNPVLSENITGLARLIRAALIPALENVTLWHERDISHSSVERVTAPDATILTDFALHRMTGVVDSLVVYPERMKQNMESLRGLVFSQSVLVALVEAGMQREEAYKIVQGHAMKAWLGKNGFYDLLAADKRVSAAIPKKQLKSIFDYGRFTTHVDKIIKRALND